MGDVGERQTLVVIGNGMTSHALCRRLAACGVTRSELRVIVFGEEPRPAYDRVHLTDLFAGKTDQDLTLAPASWYEEHEIDLYLGDPVLAVDRDECLVRSQGGVTVLFDRLVFASGSRPHVPPIAGSDLPGVFVYRTVADLHAIMAYASGATRAAVIGGGLLGLEAARAVRELGLDVHVIEASPGLLPRQLDPTGARLLRERIEELGVRVKTGARTTRIDPGGRIQSAAPPRILSFDDGSELEAELVILAAGIRPRSELAAASGLQLAPNGGIVVDDRLTTSDPRIFAVGECASHRGTTYGLAAPGFQMVDVLVNNLGGGDATFAGASPSARLKLMGVQVASLGRPDEKATPGATAHTYLAGGVYRKLVIAEGRIIGAIAVGAWDDLVRIEDALAEPRSFSFWDLRRFRGTGTLFLKSESPPVHEWPAEALVCGCLGVRRGALTEAELAGACTVEALSARTGAGTMCGSCRPLLADYLRRERVDSLPPSQLLRLGTPRSVRLGATAERGEDTPPTLRCEADGDGPVVIEQAAPADDIDDNAPLSIPELAPPSAGSLLPAPPAPEPTTAAPPAPEPGLSDGPLSVRSPRVRGPGLARRRAGFDTLQSVPPPADVLGTARESISIRVDAPPPRNVASALPAAARMTITPVEPAPISVAPSSAIAPRRDSSMRLRPSIAEPVRPPSTSPPPPASVRAPDSAPRSFDTLPPPSTRRETMPPLRPISVPPGRLPSIPPPRLPIAPIAPAQRAEERRRQILLASSAAGALGALLTLLAPALPPARSFDGLHLDTIIVDRFVRQATGYAVIALSLVGLILSLRKRVKHFAWSDVAGARAIHGVVGVLALACLFLHTGLHLGVRLNRLLMLDFLAISVLGAVAGVFAAASGGADPAAAQARRLLVFRVHVLLFLPLPILVALHVLGAYYF
ncbi:MAG: FAD-dependent oxidoreductase [Minicystis sp.]